MRYLCQAWSEQVSSPGFVRQNKCPGAIAAIQDTTQKNQLIGLRLVQSQSYRIKHYWVRTKGWLWLKMALHCQPLILGILNHSVPLICHWYFTWAIGGEKKKREQLTWYFGHCSFGSEKEEEELIELSREEELSPPGFSWQHFPKTLTCASLQSFWNTSSKNDTLRPTAQNHCSAALTDLFRWDI